MSAIDAGNATKMSKPKSGAGRYDKAGRRRYWSDTARDVLLYFIIFLFFVPVLWLLITSIRPNVEINTRPPVWIPRALDFDSYKILLGMPTPEGAFGMGDANENAA